MNKLIRIALTFLLVMTTGVIQAEIVIYPVPQGIYYARHNDDYTVKVRQVGEKDWVDLYEYNVKVDMDTKSDATMVQFDFSGKKIYPFCTHEGSGLGRTERDIKNAAKNATVERGLAIHGSSVDNAGAAIKKWL